MFPLLFCKCCIGCKYRNKKKSLIDRWHLLNCTDINGAIVEEIIPGILYVMQWCKFNK